LAYKHLPPQYLYILHYKHFPPITTFPIISSLLSINILPKLLNGSLQATGHAITLPSVVIENEFQPAEHLKYGLISLSGFSFSYNNVYNTD